ncbi:unnamed protein product [Brassica rapa]|uniref:Uncharacterized protein n=1 Tax=Brassica campestris TaxID=3711 RepID=A0A8D9H803_BRACM|nr:unnamed protein product [Brassica rapa]
MLLDWVEQEAQVAGCRSTSEAERYQGRKRKQENKREMEYRPPKQAISSKVYDLDLNGFTESELRVVLSAFMILSHPDAVFNSQGDKEAALNDSAKGFLREFKLLIKVIKEGHVKMSVEESKLQTLRSQLDLFDKAWCAFLNSFVLWKVKDARLLGEDKVRAACQLEISMIQKCKITPERDDTVLTHDKKAIQTRNTKGITKLPRRIH